jgi:rRNA maturation endonuclease Nob1
MVKCSRCGVEVADSFDMCPNCGNSLTQSQEPVSEPSGDLTCSNCGAPIKNDADFCSECGTKVEQNTSNRCDGCGSEVPDGVLFCPTCGRKVRQIQPAVTSPQAHTCPNCGFKIEEDVTFCPECGVNLVTGEKSEIQNKNQSFADKIDINRIIKPTIITAVVAIVLSIIGVAIGLSWISFILAILISVGFFAGLVNNEANAMLSGFFVGLILGLLETPIIAFVWGSFAAGLYEWFYGGQILVLIILAIIMAYISNVYLKDNIRGIAGDFASRL